MITSHPLFRLMKKTIDNIFTDDLSKEQVCIGKGNLVSLEPMEDGYVENLEIAGTTYLLEKGLGEPIAEDTVTLGGSVRFYPKTYAKQVIIAEEALEDNKYKEAIQAANRLTASAYRTQDVDFASVIIQSTNSAYPGGFDQLPLAYASHLLPNSSQTYSNVLSTYSSPSIAALINAKAQLGIMLGPNGLPQPLMPKAIVCPLIQEDVWRTILDSEKVVGSNWNDINIVRRYKLQVKPVYHFDFASTSMWGLTTDAEDGWAAYEKRKIDKRNWVDNNCTALHYAVTYRLVYGWSNPRIWLQGNT